MNRERFEALVAEAVDSLPEEFLVNMENVDVVVEDAPTAAQLAKAGRGMTLLGLYEGIPHTERTRGYNMVLPLFVQHDESLIGGMVVRVGDMVYDASVANELRRLRESAVDLVVHAVRESLDRFASPGANA